MDIQQDSTHIPQIEGFYAVVHNKLFEKFLQAMKDIFSRGPQMELSRCTWGYGWNMKFKKRGRNLRTLYARRQYFTLLIVTGKEKNAVFGGIAATPRRCNAGNHSGNNRREWTVLADN